MPQPLTRDMRRIVEALEIVEQEFLFHAERLERAVEPTTEDETTHHDDLRKGYRESAKYAGILRKYHQGRMQRRGHGRSEPAERSIDDSGRSSAYLGTEEHDNEDHYHKG
jgi:hypothetical protein